MPDAIPRSVRIEYGSGFASRWCPKNVQEVSTLLRTGVPILERNGPMDTPCFVWQGCVDAQGYPDRGRRKHDRAHRQLWVLVHGPRPVGYAIHHRCEEKLCLNLAHMDLVSLGDHARHHHKGKRRGRSEDTP